MSTTDALEIAPAAHDKMTEVLSLVFGNCRAEDALNRVRAAMEEYRAGHLPRGGLLEARRAGQLVGAVFAQVLPGKVATFWPAQIVPGEPEATAETLMSRAIDHTWKAGVAVVHAVMEGQPNPQDVARLELVGFAPLAELFYLVAEMIECPISPPEGPLNFEPCTRENYDRLCSIVESTYEKTLDCPDLDGLRNSADVLEGYGASPTSCPDNWFLVRHEDQDIGCLLLGDYAEQGNCELTYMGLVPSARSNGWGLVVTRYAQWRARYMGRQRIVLAVDSGNQPARDMYAAAGFRGWDRRQVYMLAAREK